MGNISVQNQKFVVQVVVECYMSPLPESPTSILVRPPKKADARLIFSFKRQPHGERVLGFPYLKGSVHREKRFLLFVYAKRPGRPYGIN